MGAKKAFLAVMTVLILVLLAGSAHALPNPAATYCSKLGYGYEIVPTENGQEGQCIVSEGVELDEWDFYRGKVGSGYSYCARYGYETQSKTIDMGGFTTEEAVCVQRLGYENDGAAGEVVEIPMLELMEKNGEPLIVEDARASRESIERGNIPLGQIKSKVRGASLPTSFDWRSKEGKSYIGPIKNQGSCQPGSCYAFSAVANAEGVVNWANESYDDNVANFSESFIMWCLGRIPAYGVHFYGCSGADYSYSELTALTTNGTTTQTNFPYQGNDPGACNHWGDPVTTFSSWSRVECNNTTAIKEAIITYGVIDVAVYVVNDFTNYNGGMYNDSNTQCDGAPCSYTTTNHAVALVGWGNNATYGDYWILRNSWGATWGESGYMRITQYSAAVGCAATWLEITPFGPHLNYSSTTTSNGTYEQNWISINASVTNAYLDTLTVGLYNTVGIIQQNSTTTENYLFINFTGLSDGTYYINATANDTAGNTNETSTWTITLNNNQWNTTGNVSGNSALNNSVQKMNKTLTIQNGGSLTLSNVTLSLNNSANITVSNGGTLIVRNSTIVANGIESNGDVFIDPSIVWLNGNWTITGGQTNVTNNTVVRMNVTSNGEFGIYVEGGNLIVTSSNITNGENASAAFFFTVESGSNFTMNDSYLSYCGYASGGVTEKGLYTEVDSRISNNTIANASRGLGVYWAGSSNSYILDNTFLDAGSPVMHFASSSNNTIARNVINDTTGNGIQLESGSGNTLINNTLNNLGWIGFRLYSSTSGNTLIGNDINTGLGAAFSLETSTNNNLSANTVSGNGYGVTLWTSSTNNTIMHGTYNNNTYGIYVSASDNSTFTNNSATNNSIADFYSTGTSVGNVVTNLTLGNTLVTFTSLDVTINTSGAPAADPAGYKNISKYVNVSGNAGGSWIYMNVSYSAAEVSGLNESLLRMWRYNGSWVQVPGTNSVDTTANIVYANISSFSIFAPMAFNDTTPPSITVNVPTSTYNTTVNQSWAYVNASVNDTGSNVSSCILEWNVSLNITMTMIGTGQNVVCYYNRTNIAINASYTYRIIANDTASPPNTAIAGAWVYINYTGVTQMVVGFNISLNADNRSANLEWNATPGADGYVVYYSTNASKVLNYSLLGAGDLLVNATGILNTTWNDTSASANVSRFYRVSSYTHGVAGVLFARNTFGKFNITFVASNLSDVKMTLVSLPLDVSNKSLEHIFRGVSVPSLATIAYYNTTGGESYYRTAFYKDQAWRGDFTELEIYHSYVATNFDANTTVTLVGAVPTGWQTVSIQATNTTPGQMQINTAGWYSSITQYNLNGTLNETNIDQGDTVSWYNTTSKLFETITYDGTGWSGDFNCLEPSVGYMITANRTYTWGYNRTNAIVFV